MAPFQGSILLGRFLFHALTGSILDSRLRGNDKTQAGAAKELTIDEVRSFFARGYEGQVFRLGIKRKVNSRWFDSAHHG
jgi:hypothetical protein